MGGNRDFVVFIETARPIYPAFDWHESQQQELYSFGSPAVLDVTKSSWSLWLLKNIVGAKHSYQMLAEV
jgi:hypothetical protein